MTRRARLRPEDAGLPFGHRRRVPGLRREEVAQLSGVSTEYYTKIERGKLAGVSDEVLNAVARALRLTDDETAHFFNLARAAAATRIGAATRRTNQHTVPDGMQALMDSMHDAPAIVMTGCLDILAANPWDERCMHRCSSGRPAYRTSPVSYSLPRQPTICFLSGKQRQTKQSDCCELRPHARLNHPPSHKSLAN